MSRYRCDGRIRCRYGDSRVTDGDADIDIDVTPVMGRLSLASRVIRFGHRVDKSRTGLTMCGDDRRRGEMHSDENCKRVAHYTQKHELDWMGGVTQSSREGSITTIGAIQQKQSEDR